MGQDGDITMSNLKLATGISDNRLSAHHPDGLGNNTSMGDFLSVGVGRRTTSSEWSQGCVECPDGSDLDVRLGIPETTVGGSPGLPGGRSSTIQSGGDVTIDDGYQLRVGDKFWVRVGTFINSSVSLVGDFFAEQILSLPSNLSVSAGTPTGNRQHGTDADGYYVVDVQFEVNGVESIRVDMNFEDDLNTDAVNYGDTSTQPGVSLSSMRMRTQDVVTGDPYIESVRIRYSNLGGSGSYLDCVGDPLDSGGSNGDISYSATTLIDISDPVSKYGDYYLWLYKEDQYTTSPGCPPSTDSFDDGYLTKLTKTGGGTTTFCHDFGFSSNLVTAPELRVVLVRDDTSSPTVQDQRDVVMPVETGTSTPEENEVFNNWSDLNPTTEC